MGAIDEILATIRWLPLQDRLRQLERAANEVAEDTPTPASVAPSSRHFGFPCMLTTGLGEAIDARE